MNAHPQALDLSIVMPCLNEAETLAAAVAEAQAALRDCGIAGEIIVADNGSTDGSREIALAGGARVVAVSERGYGMALMGGMEAARAPYVVYADCDGSYDFRQADRLLASLRAGADLVLGSRFPAGGGKIDNGAMPWLHRYFGTPALTLTCRMLYGVKITDINSGLRGVRLSAFRQLRVMGTGMEFASEIVLQMARRGFHIAEVPATLRKDGRSRPPHRDPHLVHGFGIRTALGGQRSEMQNDVGEMPDGAGEGAGDRGLAEGGGRTKPARRRWPAAGERDGLGGEAGARHAQAEVFSQGQRESPHGGVRAIQGQAADGGRSRAAPE